MALSRAARSTRQAPSNTAPAALSLVSRHLSPIFLTAPRAYGSSPQGVVVIAAALTPKIFGVGIRARMRSSSSISTGGLAPPDPQRRRSRGSLAPLRSRGARLHPTTHRTRGGDPGLRRAWTENLRSRHPRADPLQLLRLSLDRGRSYGRTPRRPSRPSRERTRGSSSFARRRHRPTQSSPVTGGHTAARRFRCPLPRST